MDINTFIEKTAGSWFSQRTTYNINKEAVDNSKANLDINLLDKDSNQAKVICQENNLKTEDNMTIITSEWDNSPDWGKPKKSGNSTMIINYQKDDLKNGKIWRLLPNQKLLEGNFTIAEDDSLTFTIKEDTHSIEERIWFANDNLRLRNTVIKSKNQVIETSFYSEIKKIKVENKA
ncbi:phycobiliprotein lyase [Cyanobacterium stanieri LEGE 03274]|uniref:Chromophore lyase CpcS/CpeS n=1 Tax=Cyanobacterium stanieri LEGE 03274 TaxID=1828756 RepID=A0ABR9V024_9CHRO|nr:phycobiliprotein lyase [Cyanobacterium stanieri]MBE9221222.1 phycobiliprotein lyase [Cyanobacterium stanieri LEGE 03274]